jgi:hypothetical protein
MVADRKGSATSPEQSYDWSEPVSQPETEKSFIWRFRLDEKPRQPLNSDPLLELIRVQWEELLKLCIPMCGSEPVKVDGFALLRDMKTIHPIFQDDSRWPQSISK